MTPTGGIHKKIEKTQYTYVQDTNDKNNIFQVNTPPGSMLALSVIFFYKQHAN